MTNTSRKPLHPNEALFDGGSEIPLIPVCDHYAGTEKLIRKSLLLQGELGPLFDVTCDLEDGAPAGAEKAHRKMVLSQITGPLNRFKQVGIRIRDHNSNLWREDVAAAIGDAGSILSHITIPKVGSTSEASEIITFIESECSKRSLERVPPIHLLIETHGALRAVWEIAKLPFVRCIEFGLMDFVSEHSGAIPQSAMKSPGQFEHHLIVRAKTEIAAAAAANRIVASHNVTTYFGDGDQARSDAVRAFREFGYLRMWSIHPIQIPAILEAFRPDPGEIELASKIITQAQNSSWAPIRIGDELHDRASFRYFWGVLKRARSTGVPLSEDILHKFFQ